MQTLKRSSPALLSNDYFSRNFHTSNRSFNKPDEDKPKDREKVKENEENKKDVSEKDSDDKKLKEHNEKQMKRNKKEASNKKKKDADFMITLFTKGLLWTAFIYSFILTSIIAAVVLFSGNSKNNPSYEISWLEFVYYVLPSGEVKEIIVSPELEKVYIVTHPGSIISIHRPIRAPYFVLTIPDSMKFEEKVRDIERKMGIQDSIPIRYDRGSPEVIKIIVTLVLAGIVLAVIRKTKIKMSPGQFDSIVTKIKF